MAHREAAAAADALQPLLAVAGVTPGCGVTSAVTSAPQSGAASCAAGGQAPMEPDYVRLSLASSREAELPALRVAEAVVAAAAAASATRPPPQQQQQQQQQQQAPRAPRAPALSPARPTLLEAAFESAVSSPALAAGHQHHHHHQQQQQQQQQRRSSTSSPAAAGAYASPPAVADHPQLERLKAIHARLTAMTHASAADGLASAGQYPAAAYTPAGAGGATAAGGHPPGSVGSSAAPAVAASAWLQAGPLQQVLLRQKQRELQRRINQQGAASGGGPGDAAMMAAVGPQPGAAQSSINLRGSDSSSIGGGAAGRLRSNGGASGGGAGSESPSLTALQRMVREGSPKRRLQRLRLMQQQQQQQTVGAATGGAASPALDAQPSSPTKSLRLAKLLQAAASPAGSLAASLRSSGAGGMVAGGARSAGLARLLQHAEGGLAVAQELSAASVAAPLQRRAPGADAVAGRLRHLMAQLQDCAAELSMAQQGGI
jgi:hypothetical protein